MGLKSWKLDGRLGTNGSDLEGRPTTEGQALGPTWRPLPLPCCSALNSQSWPLYPWGGAGSGIGDKASYILQQGADVPAGSPAEACGPVTSAQREQEEYLLPRLR